MNLLETLLHPELLMALLLFVVISILVELAAYRVLLVLSEVEAAAWIVAHGVIPAARALALVVFILIAYPVLFGLESGPAIGELLSQGRSRLMTLVNITFLLSLLLPLLPIISRLPALILPLQGIAAASLVFHWWASTQAGLGISFWPGWPTLSGLVVLAFLTHELAKWLGRHLEQRLDALIQRHGSGKLIYRSVLMMMQAPVILLYTLSLGRQLT